MVDAVPVLPPEEALRFFRQKGFAIGFAWQDVWQEEHARAFTVAKAMSRDLLEEIRAAVDRAIADGETLAEFSKQLRPELEKRGWWGRRSMLDPATGEQKIVQLGSPRRLRTIFQTNMRTAYAAGRWERIERNKSAFPFIRYTSVMDGRERQQHHDWHGTVLPVDHPWWDTHYPPCGWNCRCTPRPINQRMLDRRGWSVTEKPIEFDPVPYTNPRTGEVTKVENGIDPGWSYNVGKAYLDGIAPPPLPRSFDEGETPAAAGDDPIDAFLSVFGATRRGRLFTDAGGWPLAISAGWFRGPDGKVRRPGPDVPALAAAQAIARPDEIRWLWIRDRKGGATLMRRYFARRDGHGTIVDVGRIGWRAVSGKAIVSPKRGLVVWSRPEPIASSYSARQPRDRAGRFASVGGNHFLDRVAGGRTDGIGRHTMGHATDHVVGKLAAIDVPVAKRQVMLDAGYSRKIIKRHGGTSELERGQVPVSRGDLLSATRILNSADVIRPGKTKGPQGQARFEAEASHGGHRFTIVGEVSRQGIGIVSMWKRVPRA
jgi:SPP1 gp7 family putative phage head morphogenesis protein